MTKAKKKRKRIKKFKILKSDIMLIHVIAHSLGMCLNDCMRCSGEIPFVKKKRRRESK